MSVALQTDPLQLSRGDLDERLQLAIELARQQQLETSPLVWHTREVSSPLVLDEGTVFVPDGEDARAGNFARIVGGIALLFGLLFAAIVLEGEQAEPWMRYLSPALFFLGAYSLWTGTGKNNAAQVAPRLTGAYLFDEVLLHLSSVGCRTFPAACIRSVEWRESGESISQNRTVIHYLDDEGNLRETTLFGRNMVPLLEPWLARSR